MKHFAITPPTRDPRWIIALLAGLPLLIVVGLAATGIGHRPVPPSVTSVFATVFLLTFLVLSWAAKRQAIAVDNGVLEILAAFWRRRIPVQEIDLPASRVIDLREHRQWRPLWKTNGFGLPGLRAGWYRSGDWTSLFCLLTDRRHVALLPLRAGGAVLLSAAKPIELLAELRAVDDERFGRR